MGSKYTKEQGQRLMNRYHSDEEFRKRFIQYTKNYHIQHPLRAWAMRNIFNHRKRGFPILITRQELEELAGKTKICKLCGSILEYGPRKDGKMVWNHNSASVDRIDNTKPLTLDNIQIICKQCNSAKSTMSMDEFLKYCKCIIDNSASLK